MISVFGLNMFWFRWLGIAVVIHFGKGKNVENLVVHEVGCRQDGERCESRPGLLPYSY